MLKKLVIFNVPVSTCNNVYASCLKIIRLFRVLHNELRLINMWRIIQLDFQQITGKYNLLIYFETNLALFLVFSLKSN